MRLLFLQLNNIILGKTFYFLKWATQNSMLQAQTNQKRIIMGFRLQEQTDTYNIYIYNDWIYQGYRFIGSIQCIQKMR